MRLPFRRNKYPKNPHLNMVRGPDGRFVAGINPDGSPASPRPDLRQLRDVTEYVKEAGQLHTMLKEQALEDLRMKRELSDMFLDGAEADTEDGDGMPSMEQLIMQLLMNPQMLKNIQGGQSNPSDPWPDPAPSQPTPGSAYPVQAGDPVQGKGGIDRLNLVLRAISKVPDKAINMKVIDSIALDNGIDKDALMATIRKLAPACGVMNG